MNVEDLYKVITKTVFIGKCLCPQDTIRTYKDQHNLPYFQVTTLGESSAAIYKVYYQKISESARLSLEDFPKDSWHVFDNEGLILGYENTEIIEYNHDICILMNKDIFEYIFFIENAYSENLEKVGYDFFSYIYCFAENWKLFENLAIENTSKSHDLDFYFGRIKKEFLSKRLFYVLDEGSIDGIEYKLIKTGNKHLICAAYYLGNYLCTEYSKTSAIKKAKELLQYSRTEEPAGERVYNPEYEIPDEVDTSTDAGQKCLEDMNALMKAAIGK